MHAYSRWDRPYRLKGLTSHERVDIPGHRAHVGAPADAGPADRAHDRTDGCSGGRRAVPAERATTEQHPSAPRPAAAEPDPTRELCGDAEADGQAHRGGHGTC